MSVNIEESVNTALTQLLSYDKKITEIEIDNYTNVLMNKLNELFGNELASDEEIKKINHIIKARLAHKITKTNSVLINPDFEHWFMKKKPQLNMKYWNRYSIYLEKNKHFSKAVIENIDDVCDEITDLLGDPTIDMEFQRRGLIIGDVQSGKTANFIGLMCKASDAGYKLIVVLAGTSNTLRSQTQERIDEGIIGNDSEQRLKGVYERIGASLWSDDDFSPVTVTSVNHDFNRNFANSLALKLNQTSEPIVFVIKKNVPVLQNLNAWIKSLNQTNERNKIDNSLLLIDDEADYASINTNNEDTNPTRTNEKIVELLGMFAKTSYVGFTATPYANVFIDPDNIDDMETENLFPRDYIYCLDAPSNYIGARDIFGDKDCKMLKTIGSKDDDRGNVHSIHNILPLNHKKEADFAEVPDTLKSSILEFFLGNTIRDLWGDIFSHRSMMINISRFIKVHEKIRQKVESYVKSVQRSITLNSKLDNDQWKKDSNMMDLYNIYQSDFLELCEDQMYANSNANKLINWDDIRKQLYESCIPIFVSVINQKSHNSINYAKNKAEGLRVIAIGGIGLSRGLTLEGLMVSYFFRSSVAYDTLMQMGRWFGYRDGYRDLCRIWMTDETQEWYYSINRATEELRESIVKYKNSGLTPLDFGIKVRTDPNLLITARNKMRTAKEQLVECTLSSKIIEAPYLFSQEDIIKNNFENTIKFIDKLKYKYVLDNQKEVSSAVGYHNVDYKEILEFIKVLNIPSANLEFENEALGLFIEKNKLALSSWDIALIQGNGETVYEINDTVLKASKREIDIKPNTELIRISRKRCRVGGPSDGKFGLSVHQTKLTPKEGNTNVSQKQYFEMKRNPLLCIYFIECNINSDDAKYKNRFEKAQKIANNSKNIPLVTVSIGIPDLGKKEQYISYATNKIQQGLDQLQFKFDDEGIDDE